jgi:hypothetical protein
MQKQSKRHVPQSYEGIIGAAIMGNEADRDVAIDRATLKMLVCQQLTCANTGAILDQRSAVALEVKVGEKTRYFGPYAPSELRKAIATAEAVRCNKAIASQGVRSRCWLLLVTVKILNGKELF